MAHLTVQCRSWDIYPEDPSSNHGVLVAPALHKDRPRRGLTQRLLRFGKVDEGFPEGEGIHARGSVGGLDEGNVWQES